MSIGRRNPSLDKAQRARMGGDYPRAVKLLAKCFKHDPHNPRVWHEAALVAQGAGDHARAVEMLEAVLEVAPHRPDVAYHLGIALECLGEWEAAETRFAHAVLACRAARDFQGYAVALTGQANCNYRLGDRARGHRLDQKVLATETLDPTPDGRYARSLVALRQEQWTRGWADYESRWDNPEVAQQIQAWGVVRRFLPPAWDGQSEGTVLVYAEQGAGDVLWALRYLRPGMVLLVRGPIVPVLRELVPDGVTIVDTRTDTTIPACQWSAAILSLPHLLGTSTPVPPAIVAGRGHSGRFRAAHAPFRVGVCWHGERKHQNDRDRSCPRSFLPDFAGIDGIEAVSLQHGEPTVFRDYAESAALLRTLDAVVTVDTSVAHLAGTLGVPTIVLPPTVPDWRWPDSHGERTPWYPSVTLVRRERSDAWEPAIQRACELVVSWRDQTRAKEAA